VNRDSVIRLSAIGISLLLHGIWFIQAGGDSGAKTPLTKPQQMAVTRLTFTAPQQEIAQQEQRQEKAYKKKDEKAKPVKKEVVRNEPSPEPPQEEQLASIPEASAEAPALDEGLIEQERQRYLAAVMAHIERHKRYPKTARRRGITGELSVFFLLMQDGSVKELVVRDGPEVLIDAARESVQKAMPMPVPPSSVDCPMKCRFRMKFSLNEA